jgi:tetratricopeptide (TPR) repeat protein
MDWLISIAENLASNVIWKILGALATTAMIAWLVAWWVGMSRRGKVWAVIGASVFLIAATSGAYIATRKPPPDRATSPFAVLVVDLDGDADRSQTRHILQSLRTQFGEAIARGDIEILSRGEALIIPPGNIKDAEAATTAKGRSWLKEQNASVLIWGEVGGHDKLLRLRLLPAEGDGASKAYALAEQTLELPNDFGGDLGALFAARTATAISPVYDRAGEALANLIAPFAERLKPLAEKPPASFSDETRAQLWNAYAAGEAQLGEEHGDNARLASAIAFYKKTLTIWTRDKVPLNWAGTQNNLGLVLRMVGELGGGTARLEEAVVAYRAALLEWTRDQVPLYWAGTQNNLGDALQTLGEREISTARLEEAVAAYRAALLEWTRERVPLDWARTQNNLGNALLRLGERESGTARLEEAVAAYRAALLEWTRNKVPLYWAATQTNLGLALENLGERESGTTRLEEAVASYRAALLERTRERVPLDWAKTQNNLGGALRGLGAREAETDKAKGCATLKTAREHFAAALEEFQRAGASYYVEVTQGNVAQADGVIARLCR